MAAAAEEEEKLQRQQLLAADEGIWKRAARGRPSAS